MAGLSPLLSHLLAPSHPLWASLRRPPGLTHRTLIPHTILHHTHTRVTNTLAHSLVRNSRPSISDPLSQRLLQAVSRGLALDLNQEVRLQIRAHHFRLFSAAAPGTCHSLLLFLDPIPRSERFWVTLAAILVEGS